MWPVFEDSRWKHTRIFQLCWDFPSAKNRFLQLDNSDVSCKSPYQLKVMSGSSFHFCLFWILRTPYCQPTKGGKYKTILFSYTSLRYHMRFALSFNEMRILDAYPKHSLGVSYHLDLYAMWFYMTQFLIKQNTSLKRWCHCWPHKTFKLKPKSINCMDQNSCSSFLKLT